MEDSDAPPNSSVMELDLLDKKIRRLVCKLKKFNIDLEVFSHEHVEYGCVLGRGAEGVVRHCTVIYNGVTVEAAAKTVADNSEDAVAITLDEIELLCLANDPIINTTQKVYGVVAQPCEEDSEYGRLVIITEAGLMNALQLYSEEPVPLHVTLNLWSRLAAALHTMHTKKIIHQDLKPDNILITAINRDKFGQICKIDFKVIDLGMAKRVYTEKIVTDDILGTTGYHAPEVLLDDSYDFSADVFMLGITFCVLLHSPEFLKSAELQDLLKELHAAKQRKMAGEKLFNSIVKPTLGGYTEIPDTIHDMICTMLERAEERHITLLDIAKRCRDTSGELRDASGDVLAPALPPYAPPALPDTASGCDSGFSASEAPVSGRHPSLTSHKTKGRRVRRVRRGASRASSPAPPSSPPPPSEHSGRSVTSVYSDVTGGGFGGRLTRSRSVTSVASDVTTCSDVTEVRRAAAAARRPRRQNAPTRTSLKRLRSETSLTYDSGLCPPPARRFRHTTRKNYTEFFE